MRTLSTIIKTQSIKLDCLILLRNTWLAFEADASSSISRKTLDYDGDKIMFPFLRFRVLDWSSATGLFIVVDVTPLVFYCALAISGRQIGNRKYKWSLVSPMIRKRRRLASTSTLTSASVWHFCDLEFASRDILTQKHLKVTRPLVPSSRRKIFQLLRACAFAKSLTNFSTLTSTFCRAAPNL